MRHSPILFTVFLVFVLAVAVQAQEGKKHSQEGLELLLPKGLDPDIQYIPEDNPLTSEKIELGRKLYFDKRLSADNSVACATCHSP